MTSLADKDDWEAETTVLDEYQNTKVMQTGVTSKSVFEIKNDTNIQIGDVFKRHSNEMFVKNINQNVEFMSDRPWGGTSYPTITLEIDVQNPQIIGELQNAMYAQQYAVIHR